MQLQRLFERYNAKYFGGRLPAYQVLQSDLYGKGDHGLCRKKQREIHLGTDLKGMKLRRVLLHEMAHAAANGGHGKAWQNEMLRLAEIGAPTRGDLREYQDPNRIWTWAAIKGEVYDAGLLTDIPWNSLRPQIGLDYGQTDARGRSESKGAARRMRELRVEFIKGRRERKSYQRLD